MLVDRNEATQLSNDSQVDQPIAAAGSSAGGVLELGLIRLGIGGELLAGRKVGVRDQQERIIWNRVAFARVR
jgi:hypothetical protein